MSIKNLIRFSCVLCLVSLLPSVSRSQETKPAIDPELAKISTSLESAFNAGDAAAIAGMFLPNGEVIDEHGHLFQNTAAIQELLSTYFVKFPGVSVVHNVDSMRVLGQVALQEGTRVTSTKDGITAQIRYLAVLTKTDQGWRIASLRDFPEDYMPTPADMLHVFDWMIGDWVSEGYDGRVSLSYKWSEDNNYIVGKVEVVDAEGNLKKSDVRIAWDAVHGLPKSWRFDSDGTFTEAMWTAVADGWIVRNDVSMADGQIASSILKLSPVDNDRYKIHVTQRMMGSVSAPDQEIIVVKQPPKATAPKGE
jgi:uncharacterized protein (TIGR02246 family)